MVAKLYAFLKPSAQTFRKYPESDTSLPARYARAIAYYEIPDLAKALEEVRGLTREYPDDPYFHELEGPVLFEHGISEARRGGKECVSTCRFWCSPYH